MKKIRTFTAILFSLLLIGGGLAGCNNDPEPETVTNPVQQSSIDNAIAGSIVNLSGENDGGSLVIDKPLTVNGNGARNIAITISAGVRQNVVLRNFRNAKITVSDIPARMARVADDDEPMDKSFKYLGDDALPVKLEGCTVDLFEAKKDVAIYLDNGEKKSDIAEIKLKDGVEDFTFVEFDKSGIITDDKSEVGKLSIEDGVEKINLIGGTFGDVALADDFSGSIDFKYDKEFDDQLNFPGKDTFLGDAKIAEKDVGVAEKNGSNNVYEFTLSNDLFSILNGHLFVLFRKDSDASAPIYAAIPTGLFTVDTENKSSGTSIKSIYGSERGYVDYAAARARGQYGGYLNQDVVKLTHYRNYNKEAFVASLSDTDVKFYVDTSKIRKEDVIVCSPEAHGPQDEACTKVSEINLEGYTPYFAADSASLPALNSQEEYEARESQITARFGEEGDELRCYNSVKFLFGQPRYKALPMTQGGSYPDVSGLSYSQIAVDTSTEDPFGDDLEPEDDDYLNIYAKNVYFNCDWDTPYSSLREDLIRTFDEQPGVKYYPNSKCTAGQELTVEQIQSLAKYAFVWKIVPPSAQTYISLTPMIVRNDGDGEYYVADYDNNSTTTLQDVITQANSGKQFYLDMERQRPVSLDQLQSGAEFWSLYYIAD